MKVYVVTGFGMMIDTICSVFKSYDEAKESLEEHWKESGIENIETIVENRIWKTCDDASQDVEWEIHEREI